MMWSMMAIIIATHGGFDGKIEWKKLLIIDGVLSCNSLFHAFFIQVDSFKSKNGEYHSTGIDCGESITN